MTVEVRAALDAATALVGSERVTAELGNNTGLFRRRNVFGVVRPRNVKDVQRLTEIFGETGAAALHAFSTGRNWGLRSPAPAAAKQGVVRRRGPGAGGGGEPP